MRWESLFVGLRRHAESREQAEGAGKNDARLLVEPVVHSAEAVHSWGQTPLSTTHPFPSLPWTIPSVSRRAAPTGLGSKRSNHAENLRPSNAETVFPSPHLEPVGYTEDPPSKVTPTVSNSSTVGEASDCEHSFSKAKPLRNAQLFFQFPS